MKEFKIGTVLIMSGLYTGERLEKIISRTENEIVSQELAYPDSEPNRYAIEVDYERGTERFLNWEYRGEKAYVYPDDTPENTYRASNVQ